MEKRVLAIILTLLLAMSLLPMTASAASSINLTKATSDQKGDGWIWEQATKTLTLTGVHVSGIDLPEGSTIRHSGMNEIDYSIYTEGDLQIRGFGTLKAGNISVQEDKCSLVIDGGHLVLSNLSAENLTIKGGYITVSNGRQFAPVNVTGRFVQEGGYLRIENTGSGNGIDVSGFGAVVKGGFLDVTANTASAAGSGAIFCSGNEFINEGGVVKAVNKGQGPAMHNSYDAFGACGGVTVLQSVQGSAIAGKAYTYNNELAMDKLDVYDEHIKTMGFEVGRDQILTGSEYVFCKMLIRDIIQSMSEMYDTQIDGLYCCDYLPLDSQYKGKNIVVTGGSYITASESAALYIGSGIHLLGSGTLVGDGTGSCSGLSIVGKNTDFDYTLEMTGNLICVSDDYPGIRVSSGINNSLTVENADVIAVSKAKHYNAIDSMESIRLKSSSRVVAVQEGSGAALGTADLAVQDAVLTCYSTANSGYNGAGNIYSKDGGVVFENCSVSAVGGEDGYGLNVNSGYNGYVNEVTVKGSSSLINLYSQISGLNQVSGARNSRHVYTPVNLDSGLALLSSDDLNGSFTDMTDQLQVESRSHVYRPHMLICSNALMDTLEAVKYADPVPQPQPEPEKPVKLTTPFVDVPKDAYYYDATVWAYNAEPQITDGNGKDKFMPEQICTRGQVVTFLWRAAGEPEPKSTSNPFTDVKSTDYFYKPVLWAVEQGITDGTTPSTFSPNNPCKNSHILTFIWRALGKPDDTGNAVWYQDAYNWAAKNHLLDGTYTGQFDINAQCPRKNVVQYLYVYYTMK